MKIYPITRKLVADKLHTAVGIIKVKKVKNKLLKRHTVHTINTDTEALATLQLAD